MECRIAKTFDWEWGPSTLQRLGKAQALRIFIYIYLYIVFYYIILYYSILYYIILYYNILSYIILYCIVLYYIILHIILYYIICYLILYYIILYYIIYHIILYYIILYYIMLYYIVSYYIILCYYIYIYCMYRYTYVIGSLDCGLLSLGCPSGAKSASAAFGTWLLGLHEPVQPSIQSWDGTERQKLEQKLVNKLSTDWQLCQLWQTYAITCKHQHYVSMLSQSFPAVLRLALHWSQICVQQGAPASATGRATITFAAVTTQSVSKSLCWYRFEVTTSVMAHKHRFVLAHECCNCLASTTCTKKCSCNLIIKQCNYAFIGRLPSKTSIWLQVFWNSIPLTLQVPRRNIGKNMKGQYVHAQRLVGRLSCPMSAMQ